LWGEEIVNDAYKPGDDIFRYFVLKRLLKMHARELADALKTPEQRRQEEVDRFIEAARRTPQEPKWLLTAVVVCFVVVGLWVLSRL
jgi:hypothetical protein